MFEIIGTLWYSFSFVAPCLLQNGTDVKKIFETPSKSVRTTERNFFDDYTLMDILGYGSYSICKLARHNTTNQQYAVKVRLLILEFIFVARTKKFDS